MTRGAPRRPRRRVVLPPRRERPSAKLSARTAPREPLGQRYHGEYAPYRLTRRVVVLRSVLSLRAFVTSEVSGPLDPDAWR